MKRKTNQSDDKQQQQQRWNSGKMKKKLFLLLWVLSLKFLWTIHYNEKEWMNVHGNWVQFFFIIHIQWLMMIMKPNKTKQKKTGFQSNIIRIY